MHHVSDLSCSVSSYRKHFENLSKTENDRKDDGLRDGGAAPFSQSSVRSRVLTYSALKVGDASPNAQSTVVRASEAPRLSSKVKLFERKIKRASGLIGQRNQNESGSQSTTIESPVRVRERVRQFSSPESFPEVVSQETEGLPPKPTPPAMLGHRRYDHENAYSLK